MRARPSASGEPFEDVGQAALERRAAFGRPVHRIFRRCGGGDGGAGQGRELLELLKGPSQRRANLVFRPGHFVPVSSRSRTHTASGQVAPESGSAGRRSAPTRRPRSATDSCEKVSSGRSRISVRAASRMAWRVPARCRSTARRAAVETMTVNCHGVSRLSTHEAFPGRTAGVAGRRPPATTSSRWRRRHDVNATCRCVSKAVRWSRPPLPLSPAAPAAARSPVRRRDRAAKARVGGRSARVVARVLETTLEVLGRDGFAGLRIEDVAGRAGVNKTTIYRRWPTPGRAGRRGPDHARRSAARGRDRPARARPARPVHERDDAAGDAGRTRHRQRPHRRARRSRSGSRVQRAARDAPARRPGVLLEHARRRGELPRRTDIDLLLDVLTGAVYGRLRECPSRSTPTGSGASSVSCCPVWAQPDAAREARHAP